MTVSSQSELMERCLSTLRGNGWRIQRNLAIAPSPKGGLLRADILALHETTGKKVAVYPRWQATHGTAEEKIPFQMIKVEIAKAARPDCTDAAYFVLEGAGWTWHEFYLSNELAIYLSPPIISKCIRLETFSQLTASGAL